MKNIFNTKEQDRDNSFKWPVGTLLRPDSTDSFNKHGFVIVVEHKDKATFDPSKQSYVLYSQTRQAEWEVACWVVNLYFKFIASNK